MWFPFLFCITLVILLPLSFSHSLDFFFHPFPLQTLNLQKECPHQAVIKLGSNLLFRISCYTVLEIIWHEGGALLRHHDSA